MKATGKINLQAWMADPETWEVMKALTDKGGEARFVGGCVRDSIVNRRVYDVDIATSWHPSEVIERLQYRDIKVVPTGIDHGTVTAIVDGKPFEITTLRHDVKTYGRHADVEFTDDWIQDAARRDFTMNAIFCDLDGTLYDLYGGVEDLRNGHILFVGDAEERIMEDVLRILRFFRFYAHFGKGEPDKSAVKAIKKFAHLIPKLSAERIHHETLKLLEAEKAHQAWHIIVDQGILPHWLPEAQNVDVLGRLIDLEQEYNTKLYAIRRLAALLPEKAKVVKTVANYMRLSKVDRHNLELMCQSDLGVSLQMSEKDIRQFVYRYNNDVLRNQLLLVSARTDQKENLLELYHYATSCRLPEYQLLGQDVLDLGITPGPQVGDYLRQVEQWWIDQDFKPLRRESLDYLKNIVQV